MKGVEIETEQIIGKGLKDLYKKEKVTNGKSK